MTTAASLPEAGFNARAIDDAFHAWFSSTTGLGASRTWWDNQGITEVTLPLGTLKWINESPFGFEASGFESLIADADLTGHDDPRPDVELFAGQGLNCTLSLNVFCEPNSPPDASAFRRLSTAIARLLISGHRQKINDAGCAILRIGGITTPSPGQAQCDIECMIASNVSDEINSIQIVNIQPVLDFDVMRLFNMHFIKPSAPTAGDGFGSRFSKTVSADGNMFAIGSISEDSSTTGINSTPDELASASGSVHVFRRTDGVWVQDAYIKPHNTGINDQFGCSVKLLGNMLIVGSWSEDSSTTGINPSENNSGNNTSAVYVFERVSGNWMQTAFIKPSGSDVNGNFGVALDFDGRYLIVGAVGSGITATGGGGAYIYERVGDAWVYRQRIIPPIVDAYDVFGGECIIRGDIALVYAAGDDSVNQNPLDNSGGNSANQNIALKTEYDRGAVHFFRLINGSWVYQQYIKAMNHDPVEAFGIQMKFTGSILFIGASATNFNTDSGCVFVFEYVNGLFVERAIIKPTKTNSGDYFGSNVDSNSDGSVVLISSPYEDSNAVDINGNAGNNSSSGSGAAYLFKRTSSTSWEWEQIAYIKPPQNTAGDNFGSNLAMTDSFFVIGSSGEDTSLGGIDPIPDELASSSGAAYVFDYAFDSKVKEKIIVMNSNIDALNYDTGNDYDSPIFFEGGI